MQPLFKNKTTLSTQNYSSLLQFHQSKNNWKYTLYTATIAILFVICVSFHIVAKNYLIAFFIFTLLVCFLSYRFIEPHKKVKKEYESDKVQNNLVNYYSFFPKYFVVKNSLGTSKLKYYSLYKVYETKSCFYIYLDKINILIVEKNSFIIGTANEFEKFIKNKLKFKFKKIK